MKENEQTACEHCYKECSKDDLIECDGNILCIRCAGKVRMEEEIKDIDRILWNEQPPDDEWYFAINQIQNSLEFEICDYENKVAQLVLKEQEVKKVYSLIGKWLRRKR